ncbi:MAG: hypothetical protein KIT54_10115 [Phycisphaeraceae bacterium]|nr:hypothetical protein [Phycisphaeraceae bacterium]
MNRKRHKPEQIISKLLKTEATRFFDSAYTLDGLGRVLGETRGNWVASAISTTREERNWALTAMGNWASRDIDLDGSGIDFAEDNLDPDLATHFNNANQWMHRNVTTGGSPVMLDYDDNGNLIDDGEQYAYIYDAWNRLVGVDSLSTDSPITRYRYNGLGQRIVESDGTTNTSLIYDERWRLISRSEAGKYTEETLYHHAGLDGMGGASDIDGVILRRTFLATGTPQTEDKRWYVLQNWRQDAAVIISDAGVQRERAFYSPYGRVFGMPAGDLNFDGEFTSTEATTISGWSAAYRAYADVNLDGVIDGDDATANTTATMGWDVLSRDGSTVGMTGATFSRHIAVMGFLSGGVYHTELGRMVSRSGANANSTSRGTGFFPCYGPCCEVSWDSLPRQCGPDPVDPPVEWQPMPGPGEGPCGFGETLDSMITRCNSQANFRRAMALWNQQCHGRTIEVACKDNCDGYSGKYCCKKRKIILCTNGIDPVSCDTFAHELMHAADHCSGASCGGLPFTCGDPSCRDRVCTETRAYAMGGDCCSRPDSEWDNCLRERVQGSLFGCCLNEDVFQQCIISKREACEFRAIPPDPYPLGSSFGIGSASGTCGAIN